jgi:hypothetical protein
VTSGDPLLGRPRVGVRRVLTTLTLNRFGGVRKQSPSTWFETRVDEACAAALDMGVQEYRFVRRYTRSSRPTSQT